jgi:hypothetical protein
MEPALRALHLALSRRLFREASSFRSPAETTSVRFGHAVMALNMPGMFVGALISYKPANMLVDEWRCFSLPLFCLWAWWFIGAGLDGLVGRRRIHWSVMALGAILSITCLVLLIGLRFGLDASDRAEIVWPLWVLASGRPYSPLCRRLGGGGKMAAEHGRGIVSLHSTRNSRHLR